MLSRKFVAQAEVAAELELAWGGSQSQGGFLPLVTGKITKSIFPLQSFASISSGRNNAEERESEGERESGKERRGIERVKERKKKERGIERKRVNGK